MDSHFQSFQSPDPHNIHTMLSERLQATKSPVRLAHILKNCYPCIPSSKRPTTWKWGFNEAFHILDRFYSLSLKFKRILNRSICWKSHPCGEVKATPIFPPRDVPRIKGSGSQTNLTPAVLYPFAPLSLWPTSHWRQTIGPRFTTICVKFSTCCEPRGVTVPFQSHRCPSKLPCGVTLGPDPLRASCLR